MLLFTQSIAPCAYLLGVVLCGDEVDDGLDKLRRGGEGARDVKVHLGLRNLLLQHYIQLLAHVLEDLEEKGEERVKEEERGSKRRTEMVK